MDISGILNMSGNIYLREIGLDNSVFQISTLCNVEIYNLTFEVRLKSIF